VDVVVHGAVAEARHVLDECRTGGREVVLGPVGDGRYLRRWHPFVARDPDVLMLDVPGLARERRGEDRELAVGGGEPAFFP
jgi:hypothetical protein